MRFWLRTARHVRFGSWFLLLFWLNKKKVEQLSRFDPLVELIGLEHDPYSRGPPVRSFQGASAHFRRHPWRLILALLGVRSGSRFVLRL